MDLIDRNELLEYQYHSSEWNDETQKFDLPVVDVTVIKNAPTIKAETVKHGKWIKFPGVIECSICGGWIGKEHTFGYKYCPHCGAKMDLESEENEN